MPDDASQFAPLMEQVIRRSEIPLFRELARPVFEDEIDALRECRGEYESEGADAWANAAARACGIAAAYVLVRRDFEESVCEKAKRPTRTRGGRPR